MMPIFKGCLTISSEGASWSERPRVWMLIGARALLFNVTPQVGCVVGVESGLTPYEGGDSVAMLTAFRQKAAYPQSAVKG